MLVYKFMRQNKTGTMQLLFIPYHLGDTHIRKPQIESVVRICDAATMMGQMSGSISGYQE